MSTADRTDDRDEKRRDKKPLSQREVFELFLRDAAVRPYLFGALGGLAMTFLVMFMNGSDVGGVLVVVLGLAALFLRWTAAPPFMLLIVCYFQVFPFFVPELGVDNPYQVRETHFLVQDVVLVMALLVYLRCVYRVFGLVQQSMPFENVLRRKGEHPARRPTGHIDPNEIGWLIGASAALVVVGQVVWWVVNALDFAPTESGFPFRWADLNALGRYRRFGREPGEFGPGGSRFFVILGALFFGFLCVRLVFGYWRLRTMSAAEGAMVTANTSWAESHRERVRVEKWRIWGRQKAVEEAKAAARALPESSAQPATRKASRIPTRSVAPTPVKSVVPGPRSRAAAAASSNGTAD
ncbi:MAG: hypothetical protein J0I06_04090 [Planctomycetes bacterium]|nr:hypothetical protein [Planctomycetota bacterium]